MDEVLRIRDIVKRPPRLINALEKTGTLHIFSPNDNITDFLRMVTDNNYSQAPVGTSQGSFELITTNAVTRWFSRNLNEEGGVLEGATIREVLLFAEVGDRLQRVKIDTTTAKAINIFSGLSSANEPPSALLVSGPPGQPPQQLAARSDLPVLYAHLGE